MSMTHVKTPTARCCVGLGRSDVTPPLGIYHRFWGAASHDQASGIHRPLTASVLLLGPLDDPVHEEFRVYVMVEHCLFRPDDMYEVLSQTSRLIGVDVQRITFTFSHTHSGGHICRARADLPGGELIGPYLDEIPGEIAAAFRTAVDLLQPAVLTYATTCCDMGHHRDFFDAESNQYVCGFNPDHAAGLPVHVIRMTDESDRLMATVVNYPCHPTTLAWDNTLISPDYVGAMREVVEKATGAPCLFTLAPCGDIGPKHGFVGDVEVADQNGRQLAYAALSALESMPAPATDYHYAGPVISGATIGNWEHRPQSPEHANRTRIFRHRRWEIPLAYRGDRQSVAEAEKQLEQLLADEAYARQRGETRQSQDLRALAERERRLLERIRPIPAGETYPFLLDVLQVGDLFWILVEGEPYYALQQELTKRFPQTPLLCTVLANGSRSSYLPRKVDFAKSLYQVSVTLLAPGCLESLTEQVGSQIERWLAE